MPNPVPNSLHAHASLSKLCEVEDPPSNFTISHMSAIQPWTIYTARNLSAAALFRDIIIGHGSAKLYWSEAEQIVEELMACPTVLKHVKSFELNMWTYDFGPYVSQLGNYPDVNKPARKSNLPSKAFPGKLVSLLSSMHQLETVVLKLPRATDFVFERAFKHSSTSLPQVKNLSTKADGTFMIEYCHNLKSLAILSWYGNCAQFIERAASLRKLKPIELGCYWDTASSKLIVKKLPELEHLGIKERLAWPFDKRNGLAVHLPILTQLKKLKTLALPDAVSVGVSNFDGGPWCGNAFMNKDGSRNKKFTRQIADQWREAEEEVASLVKKAFGRQLLQVTLGHKNFELTEGNEE